MTEGEIEIARRAWHYGVPTLTPKGRDWKADDYVNRLSSEIKVYAYARTYAGFMLGHGEWKHKILFIGSLRNSPKGGAEDFIALRDSKVFEGPFHNPYFCIQSDSQLMMARLLLPKLRVWDILTAREIITSDADEQE